MTSVLIACIILAVGAAAEIIAYVFIAKLLKKKEDGLDRRKAALDERDTEIDSVKLLLNMCERHNLKLTKVDEVRISVYESGIFANVEFRATSKGFWDNGKM